MKKSLYYLLVFVAVQIFFSTLMTVVLRFWFPDTSVGDPVPLMITSSAVSLSLIALFVAMGWYSFDRSYIRKRPWSTLTWTAVLALGIIIPLTRLEELIPEAWMVNLLEQELTDVMRSSTGYFVLCMLAPLMEEVIFRGAVITALQRFCEEKTIKGWKATALMVVLSALFFSLVHMNPAQLPHAFIVGLLLGWIYIRTGSIVPCFVLHWINNSAAYAIVNAFPLIPADAKLEVYFGGNQAAVTQAVIFSLMIAIPALYQVYLTTKR